MEYSTLVCFVEYNLFSINGITLCDVASSIDNYVVCDFVTVIPSLILLLAHGSKCSFETQRSFHIRKDFSPNGGLSLPDVAVDPGSPFLPWP